MSDDSNKQNGTPEPESQTVYFIVAKQKRDVRFSVLDIAYPDLEEAIRAARKFAKIGCIVKVVQRTDTVRLSIG